MQGHMTVNTALVITNLSKTLNVENSSTRNWIKNGTANPYDITKLLLFSDFLGSLRKPLVFTNKSTSEIEEEQLLTLTPIVDNSMQQRSVRKNDCLSFDLVLLPKHLLVRMGLFHDSLVLLSIAGVESAATGDVLKTNGNCRSRVARVNHGLNESDEDNLYLSPSMWFNLLDVPTILDPEQNSVKVNVQVWDDKFSGIDLDSDGSDDSVNTPSTSLSWSSGLPIAEEVQLALVCSPNYSASINMEKALKTFFSVERLICLGDVLAINKGPTDICDDDTLIRLEFGVVYFKVIKISPTCAQCSTYVANVNCTTLYQTGVAQSYVPASMDSFFRSDPSMDYWNHCSPPGLLNYTSQLCQMIEPYLFRKSMSDHLSPSLLLIGPNGVGKTTVVMSAARRFGVHLVKVNCHELCGETSAASEAKIKMVFAKAESCTPCILLMQNIHILGKEKDGVSEDARVISTFHSLLEKAANQPEFPLIVIGSTPSIKHIDTTMSDGFLHELHVTSPVEEERLAMLVGLLNDRICGADVNLAHVAQRSAGMMLGDLTSLVTCVKRQAYQRLLGMLSIHYSLDEEEDLCLAGFCLLQADFDAALDRLQAVHSDSIGAPKIPNVTWDDVGGLAEIKSEILDTIQLPLQHPELLVAGLRRSGVCLFGPPGTGKTLLAKAVATECSLNFLSVKGPELINMYVGQSEENVREVFSRARCASPCVIFFDELDSLAPNRGRSGDSGGVMDRVVSQLLAELDGLNKSCDVFVIGATNRPDLLDPALLRPGRFDKLLYVGISEDKESQLKVLQALTRKIAMSKECNLEAVVERCPPNMTGADFYALCSDAVLCAVKKKITLVEQGKCSEEEKLVVEEDDFFSALSTLQPSVSLEELQSFKEIHANLKKKDQKKITPAHNS
ncbi:peroxisomal ATPase PEX6-like [Lineus longissimus]|uniref:peroxisomal ATPase PEX6-like n=1 Tax=Lineus longissimus TaxID=88925 RepID=UPI00315E01B1